MKIVIPMAGFGTRLRPHTWSKPKPLVSVAGKPVLGHVLDMFSNLPDIDEVIFIVGYLGEQIESYVGDAYGHLPARYVVQDEMLGQSHAIWLAREGLEGPMFMVFVDTLNCLANSSTVKTCSPIESARNSAKSDISSTKSRKSWTRSAPVKRSRLSRRQALPTNSSLPPNST